MTRPGRAVLLIGVALVLAAGGCGLLNPPASVNPSVIEPMPPGLQVVDAGTEPCRGSGDIGWEYEYVVVLGDDGESGGRLHSHLEGLGFVLSASNEDDWVVTDGRKGTIVLRMGPVDRWREEGSPFIGGPSASEVEEATAGWNGPAAIISLEPDEACEI